MLDLTHTNASSRHHGVLTSGYLVRIHELNREYLQVLLAEPRVPRFGCLPPSLLDRLEALSPTARDAMAECPYALYSLRFDDAGFWEALGEQWDAQSLGQRPARSAPSAARSLCEVALFLAWHVAVCNPLATGLLYGMPPGVAQGLARRPLRWLQRVAADYPDLMMPRWPTNRCFWPNLIDAAGGGDAQRLRMARLLGSQLIAAELDAAQARSARRRMMLARATS